GQQAPINYQMQVVDGVALVTVNGVTKSHNIFADDPVWKNMTYYFKAGAYLQDNLGPPTEGGRVSFYQISATHLILPPTISAPPISQTASPGAALTLTATATGTLPLFYQCRARGGARAAGTLTRRGPTR